MNKLLSCFSIVVAISLVGNAVEASDYTLLNGDVNGDFERDVSDGVYLLSHLFLGGPAPVPIATCGDDEPILVENGDMNGDMALDVSDPILLLNWLYVGGDEPAAACDFGGSGGQATTTTEVTHVDTTILAPRVNPCNGDVLLFSGKINGVTHTTVRPDDSLTFVFIASWASLIGTSILTGKEYHVLGGARITFNFGPGAEESTAVNKEYIIDPDGNIGVISFLLKATRDTNDNVRVDLADISFECIETGN